MTEHTKTAKPTLGLMDAVSIVVGIIIGSAIFRAPPDVFNNVPDVATGFLAWGLGAALAVCGSLCYAELVGAYPSNRGEAEFLARAYGPVAGFAFAWAQLTVIRTGASIAVVAYVFGEYALGLFQTGSATRPLFVIAAVGGLTVINAWGLQPGRRTQNVLTLAKILGLGLVVVAGVVALFRGPLELTGPAPEKPAFALAMVFVLFAYAGWHESAYIVDDLRDRQRNYPRAILLGVAAVAVIYFAVNFAYIAGLGLQGVRVSKAVGADLLDGVFQSGGRATIAIVVIVSTLGSINGLILAGSRFFGSFGESYPGLSWLGKWRTRRDAPLAALLAQAGIVFLMVATVEYGEQWRGLLKRLPMELPLNLDRPGSDDGFSALMIATAPVFWLFFLFTGLSLIVLRVRDPDRPRPFRVPFYPITPLAFCGMAGFMAWRGTTFAWSRQPAEAVVVFGLFALGIPVYLFVNLRRPS